VVAKKKSDSKVIVSRVLGSNGDVSWTNALEISYSEAPMLVEYKNLDNLGHHSLVTKASSGGFTIARLEI
jgi:hypothetical protein